MNIFLNKEQKQGIKYQFRKVGTETHLGNKNNILCMDAYHEEYWSVKTLLIIIRPHVTTV
jgi:hypothetical protein